LVGEGRARDMGNLKGGWELRRWGGEQKSAEGKRASYNPGRRKNQEGGRKERGRKE